MNFFDIFRILGVLIDVYLLVIIVRILLSWFGQSLNVEGLRIIYQITDPYLNLFRRIRWMRIGFLDLSPLLGIYVLIFASTLFKRFGFGDISVAITLYTLVETLLTGVSSIISLFAIVTLIRIVGLFIRASSIEELWFRLDAFLQPLVLRFIKLFAPHSSLPYGSALGIFLAACFISSLGLRLLMVPAGRLIAAIPF